LGIEKRELGEYTIRSYTKTIGFADLLGIREKFCNKGTPIEKHSITSTIYFFVHFLAHPPTLILLLSPRIISKDQD